MTVAAWRESCICSLNLVVNLFEYLKINIHEILQVLTHPTYGLSFLMSIKTEMLKMLLRFQPYLMKTVEIWTKKRSKLFKWSKATFKSSYYRHVSWETLYFRRAFQIRHNYNLHCLLLSSVTVCRNSCIVDEWDRNFYLDLLLICRCI